MLGMAQDAHCMALVHAIIGGIESHGVLLAPEVQHEIFMVVAQYEASVISDRKQLQDQMHGLLSRQAVVYLESQR
jgi:hypothetical protein